MKQLYRPNVIVLTATKNMMNIPNGIFSNKRSLHISHLNISSLLRKTDEIRFILKQSNASIIGISESKLDSSILNSDVDIIEDYDLIRISRLRRGGRIGCYTRKSLFFNHKPGFCPNTESIFIDIFCLNQSQLWWVCYVRHLISPDL